MKAERQRLDKWLWFARFTRTRALAVHLIGGGHVRVNGQRTEAPSKPLAIGDVVTVAAAHGTQVVRVRNLGVRRGPAPEARLLYEEVHPEIGTDPHGPSRPLPGET